LTHFVIMERHTKYEIVIICFLFILLFVTSAIVVSMKQTPPDLLYQTELFQTTPSVLEIASTEEGDVSRILSNLYGSINPNLEEQYMCGFINGRTYKADIFGIFILTDAMKVESEVRPNGLMAYNSGNLQKLQDGLRNFMERFVYNNSQNMNDIYILSYGQKCRPSTDLENTSFTSELDQFKDASYKTQYSAMSSDDPKQRRNAIRPILCRYYSGEYQESLKTVINILVSIAHFYTRRIKKEMDKEDSTTLDTAIVHLNRIWKHADDIINSKDLKKTDTIRTEYCKVEN
jgi:hypothetical protein